MEDFLKRTWAEIDLDALETNWNAIRGKTSGDAAVMAVVKADAYGHGIQHCAGQLEALGCAWFAVSNLQEALQLRGYCRETPIFIMGYTPPAYAAALAVNQFSQAVFDLGYARQLSDAAALAGVQIPVHIKIDTGMSRLGLLYQDSARDSAACRDAQTIFELPNLYVEGLFTHFSSADEPGDGEVFTRLQFDLFLDCLGRLRQKGLEAPLRHCCNSAALALYPEMQLDLVRPGLLLYGLMPSPTVAQTIAVTPVMECKSILSMCKSLPGESPVSYGRSYYSGQEIRTATVPIGYADGYFRSFGNRAPMLLNGRRVPVLGRVCMDQCVLDISASEEAQPGDEVTVFGKSGVTAAELAALAGTISYEIVCAVSKRVPRVYLQAGAPVAVSDYLK